ncbi:MAG: ABCB family ABC transporter ATP-binding protein/permease [Alphaproteobacteria bacterium]
MPIRLRVVASFLCLIFAKLFLTFVPFVYKMVVDALQDGSQHPLIFGVMGLILSYGALRMGASFFSEVRDALFARVEQQAIRHVALSIFEHLHGLSLSFHLNRKTGNLSRGIERGIKSIEAFFRFLVFNIFPTFLEIFLACLVLFAFYPFIFGFLTLLTLIVYTSFTLIVSEWRTPLVKESNRLDGELSGKSLDSLLNYATVKYFGNEAYEAESFHNSLKQYENSAVNVRLSLAFLNFGQAVIITLGLSLVMFFGSKAVMAQTISLGDFVLVNAYLLQIYIPLNVLGFAYRELKLALLNMEEMFALLDLREKIEDGPGALDAPDGAGEILFDNVSFSYSSKRPILQEVSFVLSPGKTLGIVGPSGSGKSTILHLLFRFFDPISGEVRLDGTDIRTLTQASVRRKLAIVPQDTILFNDTLFYNIAYGHLGASPEAVYDAARQAHIHDFIMELPEQYQTIVGERGLKLSGGEKQRVAIARAILKQANIFIFDEATSSLDTKTEKMIQENLREIASKYTTLVIAHRLSTVVDADEILVLNRGCVSERGTHQQLLSRGAIYAALWEKQQRQTEGVKS